MNSVRNLVNIDLKNISEKSKDCLVKLDPTNTDIDYFSTRDILPGLSFLTENTRINSVICHNHLGITLSVDCK
jgi:hypothetical protein